MSGSDFMSSKVHSEVTIAEEIKHVSKNTFYLHNLTELITKINQCFFSNPMGKGLEL